jgi:chloramphenicol O-acetyltransferase type A
MARRLDLTTWRRREHFALYREFAQPFFNVCADVDVTELWHHCKKNESVSFTLASLYLGTIAANAVEALRMRIRGDVVWVHDVVHFSTTVLRPDNTFAFARVEMRDSYDEFARDGREVLERARKSTILEIPEIDDDAIYHSVIPWIRFTSYSNAIRDSADCFPRIVYGGVAEDHGRWKMPVGVEVHHAIVDGLDVAQFFDRFSAELTAPFPR